MYAYGFPVLRHPKDHSDETLDPYFRDNTEVSAMAYGGITDGTPDEGRALIINPYSPSFDGMDTQRAKALLKLEASRHIMAEPGFNYDFKITPELQDARERAFGKHLKDKNYYYDDDDLFKQTILSRLLSGDTHLLDSTGLDIYRKDIKPEEYEKAIFPIPVSEELQAKVDEINEIMKDRENAPKEEYEPYDDDDTGDAKKSITYDKFVRIVAKSVIRVSKEL
jgi:hypothetical protein